MRTQPDRITVFTGSSAGTNTHQQAAARLGADLAAAGVGIVYGGGRVGLMGVVADAALAVDLGPARAAQQADGHPRPGRLFAPLRAQLDAMVEAGYVSAAHRDALAVVADCAGLLRWIADYQHPQPKWQQPASSERVG